MTNFESEFGQIQSWLERSIFEQDQFGNIAVKVLRMVREGETPEIWERALQLSYAWLGLAEANLAEAAKWKQSNQAKLLAILLTFLGEAGQYRHETYSSNPERQKLLREDILPKMGQLREKTITIAKELLSQTMFVSLESSIQAEIFPLLDSLGDSSGSRSPDAQDRYMPFRIIQIGNIVERLYSFRLRTTKTSLIGDRNQKGLLREIYDRKYARFGTSGVRGRWGLDFTETRAKRVVQAICDFLKDSDVPEFVGAEDLQGRWIIIGYDSRKNARRVAEWVAQVGLANGFKVALANRDTPTPALVYYLTDYYEEDDVAGLINCTSSHNPPEWQGIKFNPRQGFPAPTSITDFIAAQANQLQLLDESAAVADLAEAESQGILLGFDPIVDYTNWIMESGQGNDRLAIDPEKIRQYFAGKRVVIDEMHGVSRGYLTRILGNIGVRYKVIHAQRDPNLPGLDYANPEEPFINPLKVAVRELDDAILGLGMDTDADRFGVVDRDGTYYRPNQVLPMLIRYLGIDRHENGRVIATQTGSPLIETLAGMIPNNEQNKPEANVVPAYIDHPFYHRRVGEREDRIYQNTFMVPVGIKYIEEIRRLDRRYKSFKELPEGWRNNILLGGEESSGLTTRGHVTDKDGIWANLLIMDMVAYYEKPLSEIWEDTVEVAGWNSYGGRELDEEPSNSGRADVDAVLEAKEALINEFLDRYKGKAIGEGEFAGLKVVYAGGIRYDFVELQLRDQNGDDQHFLRVRASGTEPINRIYVESSDPHIARLLMQTTLRRLEELSAEEIRKSHSEWRLADILAATHPSPSLIEMTKAVLVDHENWSAQTLISKLERILPTLEQRNKKVTQHWIDALK